MSEDQRTLGKLQVYQKSLGLCRVAWEVYEKFDWHDQKIIGDQFITAADSVAANIAEGYGRFHYLDRIKFCYQARGSLLEVQHWVYLLHQRKKITTENFQVFLKITQELHALLNGYIKSLYANKKNES
jgi:four helix bundle protein